MKYLWRGILLLMLLLPTALLLGVVTEPGSRAVLDAADRWTPLEIEYGGGTIAGRLRIKRLVMPTDGLVLQLRDLVAEIAPGCLWRSAVCFTQLQASYLELGLLPGADSEPQSPAVQGRPAAEREDSALIVFPVTLETDALAVEAARVHWQGGEWRQGAAQIQLRIDGSTVEIIDAVIDSAHLELHDADTPEIALSQTISLPRINLPLELQVQQLQLHQPSWNAYGAVHQHHSIELRGYWLNTQLRLHHLGVVSQELGELVLQGELQFEGDWPLHTDIDIQLAQASLWQRMQGRQLSLAATGTLAQLALQLDSAGTPALALAGQLNALQRDIPFTVTLEATALEPLPLTDVLEVPAQLAAVELEFPLQATASGSLTEQQFELHAAASGLGYESVAGQLTGRHRQGHITLQQLHLQDAASANDLLAAGEIVLAERLQWSLELSSSGIDLPQITAAAFGRIEGSLQVNGSARNEDWELAIGAVDLQGAINDLPARINGYAALGAGMLLRDSELDAQLNGAQLRLLSLPDQERPVRIELAVADLGRWLPGSRGEVELQATLPADWQQVEASGTLRDVQWQDISIAAGRLTGTYRAVADPAFVLDAMFEELALSGNRLSSLQLTADGTVANHVVAVHSRGDIEGTLSVSGLLQGEKWRGSLASTALDTPQGVWRLTDTVAMAWSNPDKQLQLAGHCWLQEQTRICPGDLALGQQGRGSLEIVGAIGRLSPLLPPDIDLQGAMQLQVEGSWGTPGGARFTGHWQTRELLLTRDHGEGERASIGWDKGDAVFDYGKNGLNLNWDIHRAGRRILNLDLLLPPDRAAPLAGKLSFEQLQLATLAPLVPALSQLEGTLSGGLQLSGSVDKPLAHGPVTLTGVRLATVGNPTELERLDLSLDFRGDWAQLQGSGVLGGGDMELAGELRMQPELRLELHVKGEQHNILYPPATQLLVSQDLRVMAAKDLLEVSGELIVQKGVLEFEQLPPGSVALSNDVVQVDYTGNVTHQELPFDIALDIWLRVRDQFVVTGSLLQTNLGGDLHIRQLPGQPLQLFGNLKTKGGELRAYGQQLSLDWGVISFAGPPDNPLIDVRAQRKFSSSGVTAGVQVQGRLQEDLELEVYSEPVMSQGEAMSYLMRGRAPDAGAAADSTAFALSVAGGVVNRSTLITELNRIPGVNNIEFGATGAEEETAATVGGYIGQRIYLSYGVGLYEPINVLTARLYLGTRLWLEVVSRLENSVDLYYSFDLN